MILQLPLLLLGLTAADTTRARLIATVGEDSPGQAVVFSKVSGYAFDAVGRLYVTDFQEAQIVVLGPTGAQVGVVGRKGEGPGEFRAPTGPVFGPDGALYVRNMSAVARFMNDPRTGLAGRFDRALPGPNFAPWLSMQATRFDTAGRYYFPLEWGDGKTHAAVRSYERYDRTGRLIDTLPVPQYPTEPSLTASVQVSPGTGRMLRGLNVAPFEGRPVWATTPRGTLISGDGVSPILRETNQRGRELRTIAVGGGGRPIPPRQRAESLAALKVRIDSLPVPVATVDGASEAVRAQRLPELFPPYTALLVVNDELWVRRWAPTGKSWFDRFTMTGTLRGTLELPVECANDPMPVVRGGRLACLVVDRETGGESVAILEVPR
jgi:hypothetical protein